MFEVISEITQKSPRRYESSHPSLGDDDNFLALLDIKQRITFCAPRVYNLLLLHAQDCSARLA